eukprot:2964384-Pyramimonas_sp.AAC.1
MAQQRSAATASMKGIAGQVAQQALAHATQAVAHAREAEPLHGQELFSEAGSALDREAPSADIEANAYFDGGVQPSRYQKERIIRNEGARMATAGLGHKQAPRHASNKRIENQSPVRAQSSPYLSVLAAYGFSQKGGH